MKEALASGRLSLRCINSPRWARANATWRTVRPLGVEEVQAALGDLRRLTEGGIVA